MTTSIGKRVAVVCGTMVGFAVLSGCGGGKDYFKDLANPDPNAWYTKRAQVCSNKEIGPSPGCNYNSTGKKITITQDPGYDQSFSNWRIHTETYYTESCHGQNHDICTSHKHTRTIYTSPASGIKYDARGNALNAQNSDDSGRDILSAVSAEELAAIQEEGREFAERYSLSETVGYNVARARHDAAVLSNFQDLEQSEMAHLVSNATGVSQDVVEKAMSSAQAGDMKPSQAVIDQTAASWGTNPETVREIMESYLQ
jgi:hypothetical protein